MNEKENQPDSLPRRDALKMLGVAVGSAMVTAPVWAGSRQAGGTGTSPSATPAAIGRGRHGGKPNIVYIGVEGIPISVLSCYGSKLMETPNFDRLAREGMRFNNAFCTNALCAPSRATLMTGKYSNLNGVIENPDAETVSNVPPKGFDMSQETFPKIMQRAGYQTAQAGKWHLLGNPGEAGFDSFIFKRGAGGGYYNATGYIENAGLGSTVVKPTSHAGYTTDVITDQTIDAMKRMAQSNKPFLMYFAPFNDHRAWTPPHKYQHIFDNHRFPEAGTFWDDYATRASPAQDAHMRIEFMPDFDDPSVLTEPLREEFIQYFKPRPKDLTDRQRKQWNYQEYMRHFMGTLKALDDNVGRILDYLDKSGLADNTIVVLTSDHGFFMGDHGWFDKRFMYEQALRVPFMVRWPGMVKPNSETDSWTVNIDCAPTLLAMAGLDIPKDMQGESIVPLLEGHTPKDWRTSMYYHYYEFGVPHWVQPHYGIRTERYKLISYYNENEWELFDLKYDPDEMDNLFLWKGYKVNSHYKSVAQDLVGQLKALRKYYKDDTGMPVKTFPWPTYD